MDSAVPHRRSEYLQRQAQRTGGELVPAASNTRMSERDLLQGLNGRLAGFIDKVRQLEQHNRLLEEEIGEIRGRAQSVSSLEERYGPELRRLRQLARDVTQQKHHIELEHCNLEEELAVLTKRHEREARSRSDAEREITAMRREIDDAYRAKLQLDRKVAGLAEEVKCLKKSHTAEVSDLLEHIQNTGGDFRAREFGNPDVTAALREIRTQLESHVCRDAQQVEETFTSQFAKLTEEAERRRECLRATQQEINEYRRQLQARDIEMESAAGTREALERQLREAEDRHKQDILHFQDAIKQLENELISCKFDMSGYLREYQDLLNVKMALDVEILSYRKLLCGEEARLSSVTDSPVSLPYIYRQSPVYTLPPVNRPGGLRRRPEPQYKFVEEIITETTREIVLSDFDVGTAAEPGRPCSKRGSPGGGGDDGGQEGHEAERDGQQDHVGAPDEGEPSNEAEGNGDGGDDDDVDEEDGGKASGKEADQKVQTQLKLDDKKEEDSAQDDNQASPGKER